METSFLSQAGVPAARFSVAFHPYAPPGALVADAGSDAVFEMATIGRRLVNHLLDQRFYVMFLFLLGIAVALAGHQKWLEQMGRCMDRVVGTMFYVLYYLVQECIWGVTLAKLITRTRVLTEAGETPSAG